MEKALGIRSESVFDAIQEGAEKINKLIIQFNKKVFPHLLWLYLIGDIGILIIFKFCVLISHKVKYHNS